MFPEGRSLFIYQKTSAKFAFWKITNPQTFNETSLKFVVTSGYGLLVQNRKRFEPHRLVPKLRHSTY